MDYYVRWSDGYVETRHWCDECDERHSQFFRTDECEIKAKFWDKTEHDQMCRPCWRKLVDKYEDQLS